MNAKDITKISLKAKYETEVFINCHLGDQAKGWPTLRTTQAESPNSIEDRDYVSKDVQICQIGMILRTIKKKSVEPCS